MKISTVVAEKFVAPLTASTAIVLQGFGVPEQVAASAPQWVLAALFGAFVAINFLEKIGKLPGQSKIPTGFSIEDHKRLGETHGWVRSLHGLMTYRGESGVERFIRQDQILQELAQNSRNFDRAVSLMTQEMRTTNRRLRELERYHGIVDPPSPGEENSA